MKLALVVLFAAALVAGILLVVRPWSNEVELTYALQFPPGFTGDRGAAAEETLDTLQKRLAGIGSAWLGRSFPDGRVRLRFKGLKREDMPGIRRVIEKPARVAVYRMAPGAQRTRFWIGQKPLLESREFSGAECLLDTQGKVWGIRLDLGRASMEMVESVEDALLGLVVDDEFFGVPGYLTSPSGNYLIFYGMPDEHTAREWARSIRGGTLLFPLGEPQIGRYRGALKP